MGRNNKDFSDGIEPSNIDIHEAVMGSHITSDEGKELSNNYKPDEVNTFNRPDGTTWTKRKAHVYRDQVIRRRNSTGPYAYRQARKGTP